MRRMDHLAARRGIGLGREGEYLVGPDTADDPLGVETVDVADCPAQASMMRFRISV